MDFLDGRLRSKRCKPASVISSREFSHADFAIDTEPAPVVGEELSREIEVVMEVVVQVNVEPVEDWYFSIPFLFTLLIFDQQAVIMTDRNLPKRSSD